MFEKAMTDQLGRIFDLGKVTLDRPGESQEQRGMFVEVTNPRVKIVDKRQIADIRGIIHVFAPMKELPLGYFEKKIAEADAADTRSWFFGPVQNVGTFRDIAERSFEFTFLFDSQYDPSIGTITSITTSVTET